MELIYEKLISILNDEKSRDMPWHVSTLFKTNYNYFSREGLRYAIEKMDISTRNKLLYFKK